MSDSPANKDWVEVLVAIGRIEEGIKSVRESIDRLDRKSDAQDEAINEMQLEIQQLKTQRSSFKENLAMIISVVAAIAAIYSILSV